MISNEKFTLEEFQKKIPEFGQALVNRCIEKVPGVIVNIKQESPYSYLISIDNSHKSEHYHIALDKEGYINSTSVYMV